MASQLLSLAGALAALAGGGAPALPSAIGGPAEQRLYVRGAGSGHGVGMSQYGAEGFALHGMRYQAILAHYYRGTRIGRVRGRTVRVLLASGPPSVTFSGATRAGSRALAAGTTYRASLSGRRVLVLRGGRHVVRVAAGTRIAGPGPLAIGGIGRYRGALVLSAAVGGRGLQVVNTVGLDDYVRGVVSAEMPALWAADALKTQAVAARSYAITTNKGGAGFDQFADTRSQVYRGVAAETARTDAAVAATRGQVVTYRGKPVTTYFFASSGGRTEDVENGFPGSAPAPWLVSVPDPYDDVAGNPNYRWSTAPLSFADVETKLAGLVRGTFTGIRVVKRGTSPRIVAAEVLGSGGATTVSGATLAARLGLRSTWADLTVDPVGTRLPPLP